MFSCFYEKNHGQKMEKRTVPHVHEDTYWSVVENRRVSGGCVVQRQVLYLVELNNNQRAGWVRTIEALSGEDFRAKQLALFPDDREDYQRWTARPSWYSWTRLNCVVHENGAHAGWDCICGISWNWTNFGNSVCRQAVRGQVSLSPGVVSAERNG